MNHASTGLPAERHAVLVDFGGVLTSSVIEAFRDFGSTECGDRDLPLRLLVEDEPSRRLLSEHESGALTTQSFEDGFAARLRHHGAEVEPVDLVQRIQARLRRDDAMVAMIAGLRSRGVPVGLISNSFGDNTYAGWDLPLMFDAVAISGREGVRKPSARLYAIACERLGHPPSDVVMIDDLAQNVVAAERLGMAGIVHRDARTTADHLAAHLGMLAIDPTTGATR